MKQIPSKKKIDEVKKNPKWLARVYSKSIILDTNFDKRVTKSQFSIVNYAFMSHVMKMYEPLNCV